MGDGKRTCLGFGFLFAALVLAGAAVFVGGLDTLIDFFASLIRGESFNLDINVALGLGIGIFILFSAIALILFLSVKNWSWLPAILGGVYTIMPDLIFGPEDDIVAIVLGVVISGLLAWRRERRKALPAKVE
jgi:hypothetical protein